MLRLHGLAFVLYGVFVLTGLFVSGLASDDESHSYHKLVHFRDCHAPENELMHASWFVDDHKVTWELCTVHETHIHHLTHVAMYSSDSSVDWPWDPRVYKEDSGWLFCATGEAIVPFHRHGSAVRIGFREKGRDGNLITLCEKHGQETQKSSQ
jgi:hypothetical protein